MKYLIAFLILNFGLGSVFSMQYDPMSPPGYGKKLVIDTPKKQKSRSVQKLILQQIIIRGSERKAIINDEIVSVGSFVQGYTVIKIEENKVTLSKSGRYQTLKLESEVPRVRR